jgi:hypothetical protein
VLRSPAAWRVTRGILAAGALFFVLWPLFRDPASGWPLAPARRLGVGVVLAVGATYLTFARRGPALCPRPDGSRLTHLDAALLIGLPLYVLLTGNGGLLTSLDNAGTRLVAPALLTRGSLDLSGLPPFDREPSLYSAVSIRGRLLPSFPLGTGLTTIPYFALALQITGGTFGEGLLNRWEKHSSALIGVCCVLLFFSALKRRYGEARALPPTIVFALGTTLFSSVGQALWTTTGEMLFVVLILWFLLDEDWSPRRLVAAGCCVGGAFWCRPSAIVIASVIALGIGLRRPRALLPFGAASSAAVIAVAYFSFRLYGNPFGGYGLMNGLDAWKPTVTGFLGNLISPSRGLLVFFPYLLFLPLSSRRQTQERDGRLWWWVSLGVLAAVYVLASCYGKWWGGASTGPRLMTEAAPFLALLTVPLWDAARRRDHNRAFLAAVLFACATQILSAYRRDVAEWNGVMEIDQHPERLWSVRSSQLATAWRIQGR